MATLRIAAVQLDFQPVARSATNGWRLEEPLAPADPLHTARTDHLLGSLKDRHRLLYDLAGRAMADARREYDTNLGEKLRDIMTFCYRHGVQLVVFPEYSIPVTALPPLVDFQNTMAIVAGVGYLQRSDIEYLSKLHIDTEAAKIAQGNNAAVILSPEGNYIVAKQHEAGPEKIESGTGPRRFQIRLPGASITACVAVCLDFKKEITKIEEYDPEITIIPSLSANTEEFVDEVPRNFARIFANHAFYGGTYIGVPEIKEYKFVDRNGTIPLKKGIEGIVIVDWDYRHPFQTRPTITTSTGHKLYARSSLVYKGIDPEVAQGVEHFNSITEESVHVEDYVKISNEVLSEIEKSGSGADHRYTLLREALSALAENRDALLKDEIRMLSRHCVLSSPVLSVNEWRYTRCVSIAGQLERIRHKVPPESVYGALQDYEATARGISNEVRPKLVDIRHKGSTVSQGDVSDKLQLVLFASLGPYGEEDAVASLPRQLTMLRALADEQVLNPNLMLLYRLRTERDEESAGLLHAKFEIVCTTRGATQDDIEKLREGFGQLIHIAFTGAYSISYTYNEKQIEEAMAGSRVSTNWWAEVRSSSGAREHAALTRGAVDWSLIVDLVRSLDGVATVELECEAAPQDAEPAPEDEPSSNEQTDTIGGGNSSPSERAFANLLASEGGDQRRVVVRVFVGAERPLPVSVADSVGIELFGPDSFDVLPFGVNEDPAGDADTPDSPCTLTPAQALQIFHPPFGKLYGTSGIGRHDLNVVTMETHFPPTGVVLGKARIRQVRSDEMIEVRLTEADRLRHVYVLGKTGTGKTNLLKNLASQDVKFPGRGVTIIDPHGDLVDYVLREIPKDRLDEVVLIDLSRTDALPVLNPLDVDRTDIAVRDRTIQELILLMHSRVYHQYTGPRFDELVRLVFQTMLDPGYPEAPSFVEVSSILMNKTTQEQICKLLADKEIKQRWEFQRTIERDPEYGGLVHYITSKFEDIARDTTLRCVMGGSKSTVDIERLVLDNGILLVKIPEAVIGKQASDLIGSLILLQLRMAIIRRREFGKLQHYHFVYVDEFQNFANTDFHTLVAEARKFNIGFTIANQNLEQLREFRSYTGVHEQRLISAIFGNVANFIAFSIGSFDAETLSSHYAIPARDILRLGRYEALARILVDGFETSSFTLHPNEAVRRENPLNLETIERNMMERYWRKPQQVLDEISGRLDRVIEKSKEQDTQKEKAKGEDDAETNRWNKRLENETKWRARAWLDPKNLWLNYDGDSLIDLLSEGVGLLRGIDLEEAQRALRSERAQSRNARNGRTK